MLQQLMTIEYLDDTVEEVHVTQYEHALFERWANRQGYNAPAGKTIFDVMTTTALRYWAYAAKFRDADKKPSFEVWDKTVSKCDLVQPAAAVDPTQTAASGELSPASPSD